MEPKDVVGIEAFERWEKDLARIKARKLVGQAGFTPSDLDDLEAELRLHIWIKRSNYDPERAPRVTYETFMTRVVENKIKDIIETRRSQKRYPAAGLESTENTVTQKDGSSLPLEEIVSEQQGLFSSGDDLRSRKVELSMAMAKAYERLTETQRELYQLLLDGFSITEAAQTLDRPRTTLNDEITRMREVFNQEGLADYL